MSSSPIHLSGSARAGRTSALADSAASEAADAAHAGCGHLAESGGGRGGPNGQCWVDGMAKPWLQATAISG